ncbi:hypothetical protein Ahy_A06g026954 isoform A [Arachis hypogaea]|uniref:Uncharacterized protein n=1 Tax=Arachis hypogaea TaxID=3818 RepID=A0A445CM72_ARAHY|nr:hypothetical protein Ahy_A06g026954 isoform A [Arachis hypogaea]
MEKYGVGESWTPIFEYSIITSQLPSCIAYHDCENQEFCIFGTPWHDFKVHGKTTAIENVTSPSLLLCRRSLARAPSVTARLHEFPPPPLARMSSFLCCSRYTSSLCRLSAYVSLCLAPSILAVHNLVVSPDLKPTCTFLFLNPLQGSNLVLKVGTPICIPSRDFIDIGRIASIENNHTPVDYAKKGLKGAIKNVEVFMDAFRAVIEERLRTLIYQGRKQILKATQQEQMTFSEPKWKLEIVVHYLWKYMTKPSVHTRKSNGSPEDATFEVALKSFSNKTGTKSTIKKIGSDVMQFLVGHRHDCLISLSLLPT